MALDREELNRRRREREAQRKKQQEQQRKLLIRLAVAAVVLVVCGVAIFLIARSGGGTGENTQASTQAPVQTQAATEPQSRREKEPTTIHIRAAGDLNVTDRVITAGATTSGYNFTACFMDVASLLADADLTMLNFEGNLCGGVYGSESGSAPQQLMEALRAAGVDIVQMANSCSINNGMIGLSTTLTNIRAAGIEPVGAFSSAAEFNSTKGYTICEVQGIKVAVVAFTKGMDGRALPGGSEDCVNLLYTDYSTTYQKVDTDGIKRILKNVAAENPDITIAMLHWGSENNDTISKTQTSIVSLMQAQGVDVILGTHSHRVQEITYDELTGNLVAYSLGDFFGDGKMSGSNYSIILDLEITKDNETGVTRVTDYSYTPIYTLQEDECDGQRRVVRIQEAMAAYEAEYLGRITESAYENMEYSLKRIESRISGKG